MVTGFAFSGGRVNAAFVEVVKAVAAGAGGVVDSGETVAVGVGVASGEADGTGLAAGGVELLSLDDWVDLVD
jgi:hypothetical protein